jgi:hypothetical protein
MPSVQTIEMKFSSQPFQWGQTEDALDAKQAARRQVQHTPRDLRERNPAFSQQVVRINGGADLVLVEPIRRHNIHGHGLHLRTEIGRVGLAGKSGGLPQRGNQSPHGDPAHLGGLLERRDPGHGLPQDRIPQGREVCGLSDQHLFELGVGVQQFRRHLQGAQVGSRLVPDGKVADVDEPARERDPACASGQGAPERVGPYSRKPRRLGGWGP